MEPADFAVRIEEIMAEECSEYVCLMVDEDEIGRLWNFTVEETIRGFLAFEDNQETIAIPTITVGIHIGDVTDHDPEDLKHLLTVNGDFINACLTVVNVPAESEDEEEPFETDADDDLENIPMEDEENDGPQKSQDLLFIQTKVPFDAFDPEDFMGYVQNLIFQTDAFMGNGDSDEEDEDESLLDLED
jgi:hypothetical protein